MSELMTTSTSTNIESKSNKFKYGILIFIFVFSLILLFINWLILFGWADKKMEINHDLANNGNGYTIAYWFVHLSYWQLIFIIFWSGIELSRYIYKRQRWSNIYR